jgi:hypothetical protein
MIDYKLKQDHVHNGKDCKPGDTIKVTKEQKEILEAVDARKDQADNQKVKEQKLP